MTTTMRKSLVKRVAKHRYDTYLYRIDKCSALRRKMLKDGVAKCFARRTILLYK